MNQPKEELREQLLQKAQTIETVDGDGEYLAIDIDEAEQLITTHTNAILQEVIGELPNNFTYKNIPEPTTKSRAYMVGYIDGSDQALSEVRQILNKKMGG